MNKKQVCRSTGSFDDEVLDVSCKFSTVQQLLPDILCSTKQTEGTEIENELGEYTNT